MNKSSRLGALTDQVAVSNWSAAAAAADMQGYTRGMQSAAAAAADVQGYTRGRQSAAVAALLLLLML